MNKYMSFLKGKKSYLIAIAVGITAASVVMGWIDEQTAMVIYGFLGAGGIAALRSAISNSAK